MKWREAVRELVHMPDGFLDSDVDRGFEATIINNTKNQTLLREALKHQNDAIRCVAISKIDSQEAISSMKDDTYCLVRIVVASRANSQDLLWSMRNDQYRYVRSVVAMRIEGYDRMSSMLLSEADTEICEALRCRINEYQEHKMCATDEDTV